MGCCTFDSGHIVNVVHEDTGESSVILADSRVLFIRLLAIEDVEVHMNIHNLNE